MERARRRRALAFDQPRSHYDMPLGHGVVDDRKNELHAAPAYLAKILTNRRQSWDEVGGLWRVVEADDTHVSWEPDGLRRERRG